MRLSKEAPVKPIILTKQCSFNTLKGKRDFALFQYPLQDVHETMSNLLAFIQRQIYLEPSL